MEDSRPRLNTLEQDHHCHDHVAYLATCESCRRALAAFLPYQNASAHPAPATRSFQSNLGPAFPPDLYVQVGVKEAIAYGVAEGVTEGLLDDLLGL